MSLTTLRRNPLKTQCFSRKINLFQAWLFSRSDLMNSGFNMSVLHDQTFHLSIKENLLKIEIIFYDGLLYPKKNL